MKLLKHILAACLMSCAFSIAATPVEGQDYSKLPSTVRKKPDVASLIADNPKKVTLLLFFSYGCPACYSFEPSFEQWLATQQHKKLVVYRIPVSFEDNWAELAKLYYILQDLKPKQDLNQQVFTAIHKNNIKLWQKSTMQDFLVQHGYNAQNFESIFDSFSVATQVKNADNLTAAYDVNATPTIIVNGPYDSYIIDSNQNGDHKRYFGIVDYVITKEENKL